MFRSKAFFSLLVMLVLAGFTAGCGTTQPAPIPPENKNLGVDANGNTTAPGVPAPGAETAAPAEGDAAAPAAGGEVIEAAPAADAAPADAAAPAAPADAAAPAAPAAPAGN